MLKRKLLLSLSLVSIQGCAILGVGGAYQTIDTITTGATAISYGTTGKGLTDHAISKVVGKDCRMFNIFKNTKVCRIHITYKAPKYEMRDLQEGSGQELQVETLSIINSPKKKEKLNVTKLGKRHERHARKVRCARSRVKNGCR
jgi:hypothetical protein